MMKRLISTMLIVLFAHFAIAQTSIRGRITDADGDAIPNATIRAKGSKNGTISNNNGEFTINVAEGEDLEVSAIGYGRATVSAAKGMVIKLNKEKKSVGEIVVTGYNQKRQSREIGYSSTNIGGAELNQAKVINPLNGLTGKVAGLNVQTTSSSVNPSVRITLRGNRHITGENQALIVVDGVLVDNDFLTKLNPNDIESTNILKGAAAAAIYGSEASNGVLIITTRRGGSGKARNRVTLTSTVQGESVSYFPKFQNRFGSYGGESFDQYLGIVFPNDPSKIYFPYENQSYGPEYNGEIVPIGGPVEVNFADGQTADITRLIKYSPVKNNKAGFFNTGMTFQNGVSVSSGDESSNLFVSYQNAKVAGVVPKDRLDRNTFRVNGGKAYGKFRLDYNSSYSLEKVTQVGGSYAQDRPIYWTIINGPQHVNYNDYRDWKTNPLASPDGYFNAYYGNPWWQIDESRLNSDNNFLQANIKASLDILPWLTASYMVGVNRSDYSGTAQKNGYTFADWAIADPWQAGATPSSIVYLAPSGAQSRELRNRINGDFNLIARKSFGDWTTKLLLGQTAWSRNRQSENFGSSTLIFNNLYNIGIRQGEPVIGQFKATNALVGVFADGIVGYKNYAFLHGSVRNETDSRLLGDKRNYTYYGVDGSLVLTDAIASLAENKYLSYAKVRAGIGKVGQVNIDPYNLYNTINVGNGFPYGSNAGFSISDRFKNPNILPEFTNEVEAGLELGFLNNRFNLNTTVYNANTINQTLIADVSAASGASTSVLNLGSMRNRGIELELRMTPILNLGKVKWNGGMNYTHNVNRVGNDLLNQIAISPSSIGSVTPVFAIAGQPYPFIKETDWKRDPKGRIIVDPNTGLPSRADTLAWFGTSTPPRMMGLNTSFNYKAFTLSAVADGRFGALINNLIGEDLDFTGISWYSAQTGRQPFVIPNSVIDNGDGTFRENTGAVITDANWSFWANTWNRTHSHYVNSADFWKLREVALTYALPATSVRRLKYVQGASFTLSGRNLFMWRPSDNVWTDPEFSEGETGNGVGATTIRQTPPTRIYGATLNINF